MKRMPPPVEEWVGRFLFRVNDCGFEWVPYFRFHWFNGVDAHVGWLWFTLNVNIYKERKWPQ